MLEENKKWFLMFMKFQKLIIVWDEFGDNEGIVKGEFDLSLQSFVLQYKVKVEGLV